MLAGLAGPAYADTPFNNPPGQAPQGDSPCYESFARKLSDASGENSENALEITPEGEGERQYQDRLPLLARIAQSELMGSGFPRIGSTGSLLSENTPSRIPSE